MKVLVCGSRTWNDPGAIKEKLLEAGATLVIHGAAQGADRQASQAAMDLGIEQIAYPANWNKYGRSAGFRRNEQMLDEGKPDLVMAFFDRVRTAGTAHTVTEARKRGIAVVEYGLNEDL